MLTKKQNMLETMRGGNPDRFVNQYEAFAIIHSDPISGNTPMPMPGGEPVADAWGITRSWPAGFPGAFPVHDEEHIVCKDISRWREYVKAPQAVFPDSAWEAAIKEAAAVDRNEYYVTKFVAPGLFEQCHYLLEIQACLMAFYEEPEAMHELIGYIADYHMQVAEEVCKHLKPDALFQHDDWGSQISTFISPAMFEEFFLPHYKRIYGYYKDHGVEVIIHHSDSYAATLVPYMIEMQMDIWQGVMTTNDMPALIKQYGGQITFMGGIDSARVDYPQWTRADVEREVMRDCTECGKLYFIPSASQGLPMSNYPGVYEALSEEIDAASKKLF